MTLAGQKFRYLKLKYADVLQMPFKGETMDMVFALPTNGSGLETVEKMVGKTLCGKHFLCSVAGKLTPHNCLEDIQRRLGGAVQQTNAHGSEGLATQV